MMDRIKELWSKKATKIAVGVTAGVIAVGAAGTGIYFATAKKGLSPEESSSIEASISASESVEASQIAEMQAVIDEPTFYPGITINGVDVGGKTKEEVLELFAAEKDVEKRIDLRLQVGDELVPLKLDGLKVDTDIDAVIDEAYNYARTSTLAGNDGVRERFDKVEALKTTPKDFTSKSTLDTSGADIDALVRDTLAPYDTEVTEATIDGFDVEKLEFVITDSQKGYKVDVDKAIADVKAALNDSKELPPVEVSFDAEPDPTEDTTADTTEDTTTDTTVAPADTTAEPADDSTADTTADPSADATTDPSADSTVDTTADATADSTSDTAADSTADTTTAAPADTTADTTPDPAEEPADEPTSSNQVIVPVSAEIKEPEVSSDDLKALLGLVSTTTSETTDNDNRNTNIRLVCEKIDGLVLQPGEQFNFNEYVGKRTAEKGYKMAHGIYNGSMRDELGGGICQANTMLYQSVTKADLQVDERKNHSIPSTYVDKGTDATVTWYSPNFRFTNNTDYPVAIHAYYKDLHVTVEIYGRQLPDGQHIELVGEQVRSISPSTVYVSDPSLPAGQQSKVTSGRTGYDYKSYKVWYDKDGNEIKKDPYFSSHYPCRDVVIHVGTGGAAATVDPGTGVVTPASDTTPSDTVPGDTTPGETPAPTPGDTAPSETPATPPSSEETAPSSQETPAPTSEETTPPSSDTQATTPPTEPTQPTT